jgi:hypothetical protein
MLRSRDLSIGMVAVLAVAVTIAMATTAGDAAAGVHSLRPADARGAVAVYSLRGIQPRTIRRVELRRAKGRVRALDLARVRRAAASGRLKVRVLATLEMRARAKRYRRLYGTASRTARVAVADGRAARRAAKRRTAKRRAAKRRRRAVRRTVLRYATRHSRRARLVITTVEPTPAPAASPVPGGCPTAFGSFGVGAWPPACWRPYADTSPFNRPLGATPRVVANSQAIVDRIVGDGPSNLIAGDADTRWDYSHPLYYARPSDPVFTIRCLESWGRCSIEGAQVRIPDAARASGGSDGHLTVIDQASGWEYDLWQVRSKPAGGGVLTTSWGGRTRIDGDGLGSSGTAAGYGSAAGIIRAEELAAGRIDHALFMVIKCGSGGEVYPAQGTGSRCSDPTNAPPMGSRFQLALSGAQIDALPGPAWKKAILRAMAEYGMYFGDTGGDGFGIQFESGSSYTSFGVEDAMVAFARQAGVPRNGDGKFSFDLRDGVDWRRHLRVVDPCESQGSC